MKSTLALLTPSVGTALSDASGVASVAMRPASLASGGAAKVSATTTLAGATIVGEANFSVGATALTLSPASIAAYGSTTLSVDVLATGVRYTDQQLNVSFSSSCVASGKATLAANVPTNNGSAQAVYRDLGCASRDSISASVQGASSSATAALTIAAPAAASVQFSSATPVDKSLVIKGQSGIARTETATTWARSVRPARAPATRSMAAARSTSAPRTRARMQSTSWPPRATIMAPAAPA
ncbi:MAG: hypothetical protein H7335_15300 [Massilia sp.]|nr:hypothetical protein [Massilia sp.]